MKSFKERIFESYCRYLDQSNKTDFYDGFYHGAQLYSRFPEGDRKLQREIRDTINDNSKLAKFGNQYAKGFMSGVHKASQARKNGTLYPPKKSK